MVENVIAVGEGLSDAGICCDAMARKVLACRFHQLSIRHLGCQYRISVNHQRRCTLNYRSRHACSTKAHTEDANLIFQPRSREDCSECITRGESRLAEVASHVPMQVHFRHQRSEASLQLARTARELLLVFFRATPIHHSQAGQHQSQKFCRIKIHVGRFVFAQNVLIRR